MDNLTKQIGNLTKQNQSIYTSLINRNIPNIDDLVVLDPLFSLDEQLKTLIDENSKLKEYVKQNKPPDQPKQLKQPKQPTKEIVVVAEASNVDDEETFIEEPINKLTCIVNMEDLKRAFFNGLYDEFEQFVSEHPFKIYSGTYLYSSDKDNAPDFIARNLIRGFVRNFDDYRKYFMICFRCYSEKTDQTRYSYPSLWIVNTNDNIDKLVEDFRLEEIDKNTLFKSIRKLDSETENLIGESYVH